MYESQYEIQYTKAVDKYFAANENIRTRYEETIRELLIGDHPERIDVKRIKGRFNDYFRIRLGTCRVVYAVINGKVVAVTIL